MASLNRVFYFLLLVTVALGLPVYAQTPTACESAVKHLTMPSSMESPLMHQTQPLTPIKFLFSSHGTDIYLATALQPPYPWNPLTDQPLTLLVVYQDEAERQKIINVLQHMPPNKLLNSSPKSLDKLKFAAIHCRTTWEQFLSTGSCALHDVQYYEPSVCVVVPTATSPAEMSRLSMMNPHNARDVTSSFNWLNGFLVEADASTLNFPIADWKSKNQMQR